MHMKTTVVANNTYDQGRTVENFSMIYEWVNPDPLPAPIQIPGWVIKQLKLVNGLMYDLGRVSNKVDQIKFVREAMGLGLKDAKDIVDGLYVAGVLHH